MTMTTFATLALTIVELPYAYDALEPYISAETLHFHHDKHYAGYVAKLGELIEGTRYTTMPLDEIIRVAMEPSLIMLPRRGTTCSSSSNYRPRLSTTHRAHYVVLSTMSLARLTSLSDV